MSTQRLDQMESYRMLFCAALTGLLSGCHEWQKPSSDNYSKGEWIVKLASAIAMQGMSQLVKDEQDFLSHTNPEPGEGN